MGNDWRPRAHASSTLPKGFVWSGVIDRQAVGNASFSVVNGKVAGSILSGDGKSYRLRHDPSGVYLLEEIDLRALPAEGRALPVTGLKADQGNDPSLATCTTDSGDDIDLMVVYTEDARIDAGGTDEMEADIYLGVELANQTYIRSNIPQRLRLVHTQEITYTESTHSVDDLDRLVKGNNGLMAAHTLRDAQAADVVALITKALDDCGKSAVMDPAGNAFESSAFSVVKRSCMSAAGKYTLAHELGHLMGAHHDWNDDSTGSVPYSHGHVQPTPAPGFAWRTVMSYDDLCTSQFFDCPRVLNWSNPNISIDGKATGIATTASPEDNHRQLIDSANTVANFRCSLIGRLDRSDTWMKDTWSDTGDEPDPAQLGQPMWESPYIWVRLASDLPLLTHQHQHENPVKGQQNFIYVKVHNGGAATSGTLEVRVVNATTGLSWPGTWTSVTAAPVPVSLAARTTQIVEVPWTPSAAGHFCLVARWVSAGDPMTTPEGSDIEVNVRGNNNIVWRNMNLVDLAGAKSSSESSFEVPGMDQQHDFTLAIRPVPPRRSDGPPATPFTDFGRITLKLDDRLMDAWRRASFKSAGLRREGNTLIVLDPKGAQLTLGPLAEPGEARIAFSRTTSGTYPRDEFGWRVIQSSTDPSTSRVGGGVTYQVRTYAP